MAAPPGRGAPAQGPPHDPARRTEGGALSSPETNAEPRSGYLAALGAFTIWGLAPLFWALLRHVDSVEVLAHRILWSAVLALAVLAARDPRLRDIRRLRDPKMLGIMLVSTGLIAVNWFVFLWAVTHGRVTEVSIGYYTNPLYNVLLGRVVLGERLNPRQAVAVGLAALGILYMTVSFGALPWVSVALAFSFGTYGLVRKLAPMPALSGLAIETGLCAPLCVAYLLTLDPTGGVVAERPSELVLLFLGGLMTASPLLLFGVGARKLRYSTLGMIQYLAPSLQLAMAVLVLGEAFTATHAVTFGCVWSAVLLYISASRSRVSASPARRGAAPGSTR